MNDRSEMLCQEFNILYVTDLSLYPFVQGKVQTIPYTMAKSRLALPVDEQNGVLIVALENLLDLESLEEIRCHTGKKIREICAPREAIEAAIQQCYHQKEDAASALIATLKEKSSEGAIETEGYDLLAQTADSPVIRLLNMVLAEAIQQGASDIHFEPSEQGLAIRYRIDGVLQLRHVPPKELQAQLITRIKVLARLDIAEQRLPQDGRIKLKIGGREIDFRVSTIPVVFGERVVLRILDKSNIVLGLDRLGMPSGALDKFNKLIHLSEGIIFVTGPTGSGKTTTLYSAINDVNSPEVNIMTIEDPVEYKLPNMAQVGVNPKINLDFARGLRHILRQDPDIIMIGEIRDKETAEIAIQASLTGHLVLSTLHTNDAPSALTRLVEMGTEAYLLSSTVVGVLAQRLVRTICPHCKESYLPSPLECKELGIERVQPFYRGCGCSHCFDLGYKGRHGIYELMVMNHAVKQQILKSADAMELREVALEHGMVPLRTAGSELVLNGVTTAAEVLRVTRGCEGE
ncbi:MAG TPA: type II secretion system ATPase GspE [Rhabdochlamydiaceae bacterium]|nr:type II secretion system ATPase GspE [Rhabdochlamydiaceae bacterium]